MDSFVEHTTLEECVPFLASFLHVFPRKKNIKFRQLAEQVLRLKGLKSIRTQHNAAWQIGRLIRNFGEMRARRISEEVWTDYIAREQKRRPRKFFDDRKYMRMILRFGRRKKFLEDIIDLPIPDLPGSPGRELTERELAALEKNAGPLLRFQIRIAWKMGLRLQEMLRLRWDQFDWKRQTILLLAADTKTRRPREVPIPPDLIAQFSKRRARAACQFVFPARDPSKPVGSNHTAWRTCKRKSGVKARWHDLRHTCASTMRRRDIRREVVRGILGMSDIILGRVYVHLQDKDLRRAARIMAR